MGDLEIQRRKVSGDCSTEWEGVFVVTDYEARLGGDGHEYRVVASDEPECAKDPGPDVGEAKDPGPEKDVAPAEPLSRAWTRARLEMAFDCADAAAQHGDFDSVTAWLMLADRYLALHG